MSKAPTKNRRLELFRAYKNRAETAEYVSALKLAIRDAVAFAKAFDRKGVKEITFNGRRFKKGDKNLLKYALFLANGVKTIVAAAGRARTFEKYRSLQKQGVPIIERDAAGRERLINRRQGQSNGIRRPYAIAEELIDFFRGANLGSYGMGDRNVTPQDIVTFLHHKQVRVYQGVDTSRGPARIAPDGTQYLGTAKQFTAAEFDPYSYTVGGIIVSLFTIYTHVNKLYRPVRTTETQIKKDGTQKQYEVVRMQISADQRMMTMLGKYFEAIKIDEANQVGELTKKGKTKMQLNLNDIKVMNYTSIISKAKLAMDPAMKQLFRDDNDSNQPDSFTNQLTQQQQQLTLISKSVQDNDPELRQIKADQKKYKKKPSAAVARGARQEFYFNQ
jgi:hypothetical protein